ncbi:hypothetical protein D3C80_1881490 [compost metagenome]
MVGGMPFQRVGNGLEVGIGEDFLEVFEVGFDFRVLRTWQRRHEPRVLHQLPCWQVYAPGLGKPGLITVFVA